jgi:hypothetical protein
MSGREQIWAKRDPNSALGDWHDATSNEATAKIAAGSNPFITYVRADHNAEERAGRA